MREVRPDERADMLDRQSDMTASKAGGRVVTSAVLGGKIQSQVGTASPTASSLYRSTSFVRRTGSWANRLTDACAHTADRYRSIFPFTHFNPVQSKVFDSVGLPLSGREMDLLSLTFNHRRRTCRRRT